MGINLFGLDIASIVHNAIQSAGGLAEGTLTKTTKTQDNTDPDKIIEVPLSTHTFSGVLSKRVLFDELSSVQIERSGILIIANSVSPMAYPEIGDTIVYDSNTYLIKDIHQDPAIATHFCVV